MVNTDRGTDAGDSSVIFVIEADVEYDRCNAVQEDDDPNKDVELG